MVSLIIPCYNAEKYIGRCLDSVLNQTDRNIELIVVNDGSTDKTARIIEDYRHVLESDITRFIYISQENEGVGAACNNALKKVTGEFLTLLDADDIMLPESIEIRRKWLEEHSTYGLVRTNGYYVTEDNLELCNRLLEVNEYMKNKDEFIRCVNEMNINYKAVKYYLGADNALYLDMYIPNKNDDLDGELVMDLLNAITVHLEKEYPNWMKLLWN